MSDVEKLLRQHGAPLPNARTIETEVRSEGLVAINTPDCPKWTDQVRSSALLVEWRCVLPPERVVELQELCKTVVGDKPAQQVLDEALQRLEIGSYMGTFIESGGVVAGHATTRMLFAYRSERYRDIEAVNQAIHELLMANGEFSDAAKTLRALREIWLQGTDRWEGGLMMLSEINLFNAGQFPFTLARLKRAGIPPISS